MASDQQSMADQAQTIDEILELGKQMGMAPIDPSIYGKWSDIHALADQLRGMAAETSYCVSSTLQSWHAANMPGGTVTMITRLTKLVKIIERDLSRLMAVVNTSIVDVPKEGDIATAAHSITALELYGIFQDIPTQMTILITPIRAMIHEMTGATRMAVQMQADHFQNHQMQQFYADNPPSL